MPRGRVKGTYHHSVETIEKIRISNIGKKRSEEAKIKMSRVHMGHPKPLNAYKFPKGHQYFIKGTNKGKHWKIREDLKKNMVRGYGKNHHNWKGGLTWLEKIEKRTGRKKPDCCDICGSKERICYDHDHKTEKFRGWLCHYCNVALGFARDDKNILLKMIKYLEKSEEILKQATEQPAAEIKK